MGTTKVHLSLVEKILITESGRRRSLTWANFWQVFMGRKVS